MRFRTARHIGVVVVLTALATLATGCGNQMLRQPSFTPLDTPRGAPPQDSVPVNFAQTPGDGRAVESPAYGDALAAPVVQGLASFSGQEPDLPPPDLSDNARYVPTPPAVNALRSPLPNDPRVVQAGHILFLNRCVQCHNPGGYGYGTVGQYLVPHPPDLAGPLVQNRSDGAIFWHVTMGQGKMPGFRHWTTPQERWSLVAYVRSLKGTLPDPNRDGPNAWTETKTAPYPAYGVYGFEDGKSTYPFKMLNPRGGTTDSRRRITNKGFGQPPPGR
jgi:mono/diheme cytochrome c family protein